MFTKKGSAPIQPIDLMGKRKKIDIKEMQSLGKRAWAESIGLDPDALDDIPSIPVGIPFTHPT